MPPKQNISTTENRSTKEDERIKEIIRKFNTLLINYNKSPNFKKLKEEIEAIRIETRNDKDINNPNKKKKLLELLLDRQKKLTDIIKNDEKLHQKIQKKFNFFLNTNVKEKKSLETLIAKAKGLYNSIERTELLQTLLDVQEDLKLCPIQKLPSKPNPPVFEKPQHITKTVPSDGYCFYNAVWVSAIYAGQIEAVQNVINSAKAYLEKHKKALKATDTVNQNHYNQVYQKIVDLSNLNAENVIANPDYYSSKNFGAALKVLAVEYYLTSEKNTQECIRNQDAVFSPINVENIKQRSYSSNFGDEEQGLEYTAQHAVPYLLNLNIEVVTKNIEIVTKNKDNNNNNLNYLCQYTENKIKIKYFKDHFNALTPDSNNNQTIEQKDMPPILIQNPRKPKSQTTKLDEQVTSL